MPELPEVENVRLGLISSVIGQTIQGITLRRRDIVHGQKRPTDLLKDARIVKIDRLGKQLALIGGTDQNERAGCVCVHLGMTGSLRYYPARDQTSVDKHAHITWRLVDGGRMIFRDPRRFGGIWTFPSVDALHAMRWAKLGEDALTITPSRLHSQLKKTQRAIKAALLDQQLVAGLGNIYVDELLFACRVSPVRPACELKRVEMTQLVRQMKRILTQAIRSGGSTLRDYVDAQGKAGGYQTYHNVYGRAGQPCVICDKRLSGLRLAGRATVYCESCQI